MYQTNRGRVETYLLKELSEHGKIQITLLDPENLDAETASKTALEAESAGSSAIMIGGSTLFSSTDLDEVVRSVKTTVKIPVILFPNNVVGISRYADAIWFMSLLNSSDPYFIIGAQMLGAPLIRKFSLEPIPMGYIVVGSGSAVSIIGSAKSIPLDKPELVASYALAAQYLGMHFVYLEAGSGAKEPVPAKMIRFTRRFVEIPIIVGGGIKTGVQAKRAASSGADIIVTGTVVEEFRDRSMIGEIVRNIRGIV